jgi:hypothetical protein
MSSIGVLVSVMFSLLSVAFIATLTVTHSRCYYFYVSGIHLRYRLSKPQGLVLPEGLGKFKNSPHRVLNPRPPVCNIEP